MFNFLVTSALVAYFLTRGLEEKSLLWTLTGAALVVVYVLVELGKVWQ